MTSMSGCPTIVCLRDVECAIPKVPHAGDHLALADNFPARLTNLHVPLEVYGQVQRGRIGRKLLQQSGSLF